MKKKLSKVLALACAGVLAFAGVGVANPVQADAAGETVAYLSFADNSWTTQYWYDGNDYAPVKATTMEVTGYGQYTVGLDFTGTANGCATDIAFFDVEVKNGESVYPDSFMTIDSVKVNGEEVNVGATYTNSDNGTDTRTNLYNTWVSSVEKGRTADGNYSDVTATPVDGAVLKDIKTIEVTFTLGEGVAFDTTAAAPKVAKELPAEGTTAYLSFADNSWSKQYWFDGNDYSPIVANNATVTGYGQYTVSLDFTGTEGGEAADIAFFDVEIQGGEEYFPNCFMTIDSVKVNGEDVTVGATYTSSDDGIATRTNLYNTWVAEVEKGRTLDGNIGGATPTPVDGASIQGIKTIEVTFTLGDGVAFGEEEAEVVIPTEFTAFLMFADGSGAWENYDLGVGTEAKVLGDGIYEVSLSAEQCGATGKAAPVESALVCLVDITDLGTAMVHAGTLRENADEKFMDTDAKVQLAVFVDGERIGTKSSNIVCGDIEENGRFRIDIFNAYDGSGTNTAPVAPAASLVPEKEIKVVFSIAGTGLNSDADTDLEAYLASNVVVEETTSAGTVSIAVVLAAVVAVVVVAGVVVVVLKKKKK